MIKLIYEYSSVIQLFLLPSFSEKVHHLSLRSSMKYILNYSMNFLSNCTYTFFTRVQEILPKQRTATDCCISLNSDRTRSPSSQGMKASPSTQMTCINDVNIKNESFVSCKRRAKLKY